MTDRGGVRLVAGIALAIACFALLDITTQTALYVMSAGVADRGVADTGLLALLSQVTPVTVVLALLTVATTLRGRGTTVVAVGTVVLAVAFLGSALLLVSGDAGAGLPGQGDPEILRRLTRQSVGSGLVGGVGLGVVALSLFTLARAVRPAPPEGPGTPRE